MFRNFNTFKRGNAAGAPIQEMSAGVFGPVCRRVKITTELCLARTSSKCFYRLAILVSRALSAATLHETCATAAQKDTTLTLRSKTQCDLFSALFRGSSWVIYLSRPRLRNVHRWLPTSEITSTRPPYPATVAIWTTNRLHRTRIRGEHNQEVKSNEQQQEDRHIPQMNAWRQKTPTEEHILFVKGLSRLLWDGRAQVQHQLLKSEGMQMKWKGETKVQLVCFLYITRLSNNGCYKPQLLK